MFDWLTGRRSQQPGQKCLGCRRTFPVSQLVFVNHCYHGDHYHSRCTGIRLLCGACHRARGTYRYYADHLAGLEATNPDQYPWDACRDGMRRYLTTLESLVTQGVNPDNENELEIAWPRNLPSPVR